MKTQVIRSVATGLACMAFALAPRGARAQATVAAARDLYAAAAYDEALAALNHLDTAPQADHFAINQYRAFCLVALGRTGDAEKAIEAVVSAEPLYHPSDAEASPRLRAAFTSVRQRILPAAAQQRYTHAKAAFDRQDFAAAAMEFDLVLQMLGDADLTVAAGLPPLVDLSMLASGFRDLSSRAAAPAPVVASEPPPVPPPVPIANRIYNAGDAGVVGAVIIRQDLPRFPREVMPVRQGILEVVINEIGLVESAAMRSPVDPRYDGLVLAATRMWKYQPATIAGTAVRFRKHIVISLKPAGN